MLPRPGRAARLPFYSASDSFSTLELYDLLWSAIDVRHVFSLRLQFSARERPASPWLDLAEERLTPRSPEPQRRRVDFLPLGAPPHRASPAGPRFAHSSRGKKA